MTDSFTTLSAEAIASVKIQRSRFDAHAFPVDGEEARQARLAALQKEAWDATHHCWGIRLFDGGRFTTRGSDAGEPAGTAGRPIGQAIESAGLADVAVIVIRYYGGVKLGTGGLARAYRDAAQQALAAGTTLTRYVYRSVRLTVPFDRIQSLYRLVSPPEVRIAASEAGSTMSFLLEVRASLLETLTRRLTELQIEWSVEA